MNRSNRVSCGLHSLLQAGKRASAAALLLVGTATVPAQAVHGAVDLVPARVTAPVSDSIRVALDGFAPFAHIASQDLGAIGPDSRLNRMILTLKPSSAQQAALQQLVADQGDPSSAYYRQWLSPAEYGARFGVAEADIAAVVAWLQARGFSVDEVSAGRRSIVFSGTEAQLAAGFHTELHRYTVNGKTRIANASAPEVPAALAPVIAGLVSINDAPRVANHRDLGTVHLDRATGATTLVAPATGATQAVAAEAQQGTVAPQFTTTLNGHTFHAVSPYDFAKMYDLAPLWNAGIDGTGQHIAIVSRSDLNVADVDSFRKSFGLPASKVNKIFATPTPGITADVEETALDVEWSGAVARGATIDLVVAANSLTSDGVDLSALYIVNNNVAPVVSMSYGQCEFSLGRDGNAFYKSLWQQAAAQGQTVFVSSGDAGSTTCDQGQNYASLGLSVNGLGSTPYNVSVGGTDLFGTYTSPSTYWSPTNDPSNLSSALGYVPEVPWNDSCGNPVLLGVLQAKQGYTDTTTAALCGDPQVDTSNFRVTVGGGGGLSNCIDTADGTIGTCTGGYTKPTWQTGPGIPSDNARAVPDVSLFAGDGLWGSFLVYCTSARTQSGTCDLSNSDNVQGAGGTSFASPAFAGIMALVNQKTNSIQGNANPVFYKLAANQGALDCTVENGSASPSCIYHDVDLGSNATPCFFYELTKDCTAADPSASFGVVSGFAAGKNYDAATGLGSVDIANLVNAWGGATASLAQTTTTLSLGSTTATYGSGLNAKVSVSASAGTPTGDFTVVPVTQSGRLNSDVQGTLTSGTGTLGLTLLPVGSYAVRAHYTGDGSFASSDSAAQNVTIAQASVVLGIVPSRTTLSGTLSSQLSITVPANGGGAPPTGTVTVTNTKTGAVLGTTSVTAASASASTAALAVYPNQLQPGSNTLSVAYSGDASYAAASKTVSLTLTPPFTAALSASSVTLTTAATTFSASTTLTLTPAAGVSLAYPITLACTGALPAGATCGLSSAVLTSPATTATVTVSYNPLLAADHAPVLPGRGTPLTMVALAGGALLVLGLRRRRVSPALLGLAFALPLLTLAGCAGTPAPTSTLTLTGSASSTTLGSSVTLQGLLKGSDGSRPALGSIVLSDTFNGTVRNLGSAPLATDGTATLTLSTLRLGTHSITAIFSGDGFYPSASSAPVPVAVTSSAALTVTATDANGIAVSLPLGVNLQ